MLQPEAVLLCITARAFVAGSGRAFRRVTHNTYDRQVINPDEHDYYKPGLPAG